jgi:hypothetical protein
MASRSTLQVFQTLGLMPTPPLRTEPQFPPSLCTAVRSGLALQHSEGGPAPPQGRAGGGSSDTRHAERETSGDR